MKIDTKFLIKNLPLTLATAGAVSTRPVEDDVDGAMPAMLRDWLVRLRLLDGVPFSYLVADSDLLPPESIRFFYLDRRFTDALVQGALSVGTVNSDDRTQLTAQYPAVREELDREERNLRRRAGDPRRAGEAGPVSGFLLRSQAVSGWPGLHVRAFKIEPNAADDARFDDPDDPNRMRLLRLERLAPAVLLCLFDGIPKVVHIEEPRQGVQFGFDEVQGATANSRRAKLQLRDVSTSKDLPGQVTDVPFRAGATGVVDIQQLERDLAGNPATHVGTSLDAAEYAMQLVRFPYRQVFGDENRPPVNAVFVPTVAYATMVTQLFANKVIT